MKTTKLSVIILVFAATLSFIIYQDFVIRSQASAMSDVIDSYESRIDIRDNLLDKTVTVAKQLSENQSSQ